MTRVRRAAGLSSAVSGRSGRLEGLRQVLDPLQPTVPGRADGFQLRDGAGELRVVDVVVHLAT